MPVPKRDSQHRTRARGIARPRDGSLDHKGRKKDPIPAANVASVLSLPPLESQEHHASSPAFMYEPQPGRALSTGNLSPAPTPLSMVELPRLVAEVGPELAMGESLWMEGPRLIASALGTDIPVKVTQVSFEESALDSFTGHGDVSRVKTADQDKETEAGKDDKHREPLTGTEVVEIFAKKRHLGKLQFFHLQAVNNGPFRPYDLRVVPPNRAGTEHFIFSPTSVLHVQDGCSAGLLSLAEWHREAVLWHRSVCKITLQRKCEVLQGLLLMAVPQLIEELKGVHWLPQDECKTYTLLDFQSALMKKNQECCRLLEIFLQYRALILNMVQEDSYGSHQELQLRVEHSQLNQRSQPLYLQLAHLRDLRKELGRAEYVLQQLGNMAALADQMIVQGLVTITHREREQPQQGSLFQAELIFGADGQPTLFPPMHLFQEVLRGALLSVFDTCSYSLDAKDSVSTSTSLTSAAQELSPDLSMACTSGTNCITAFGEKNSEPTGVSSFSSKREPHCVLSAPRLVLPKLTPLMVQGQRLRGQYYPLSRKQLEWQLSLNAGAKEVQREQARITQEAGLEIQQLCEGHSWLVDIHLFTSQWSPASLETMRGMPALHYEEHIQKVRFWTDRVRSVPPSLTTFNKLLIVNCSHIQEKIGELKLRSENLILELKRAVEGLRVEPTDFNDFTHYASMVKRCAKMSDDMQQQLEYLHSLQETVRTNYRQMTPDELLLEEQMLDLWDIFVPLLKQGAETVCQRLPSMADTLDNTFSSLAHDLDEMVTKATSGPYLDPTQNAAQMLNKLKIMCRQVNAVSAHLTELSRTSKSLRGNPLDLTFVTAARQKMEARKGLWELMTVSAAQIQEWRLLLFSKETLGILECFNQQLPVLAKLSSPTLKHKHWRNIFKGMGLLYAPEWNLTIYQEAKAEADMEQAFRKLQRRWEAALFRLAKFIVTVWQEDKPQLGATRRKKPTNGLVSNYQTPKQHSRDSGTFTIIGLETLLAQTEDSVMTLSNMLLSPHELLDFFERYQQKWVFLSKMFYETTVSVQKAELLDKFRPVDKTFKEIIQTTLSDPHVLNIVRLRKTTELTCCFHGHYLRVLLVEGLSTMEGISNQLLYLLGSPRGEFPRLCFLSDGEVIKLLSLHPTPSALLPLVRKCFRGVRWLEVDSKTDMPPDVTDLSSGLDLSDTQMCVQGVYGSAREHVPFLCPLEPNLNPLVWLCLLELQLQQAMMQLMKQCAVARQQVELLELDPEREKKVGDSPSPDPFRYTSPSNSLRKEEGKEAKSVNDLSSMWSILSEYPLQCLLVAEEALWCSEVRRAYQASAPVKWPRIKAQNASKLQSLCQAIQDGITGDIDKSMTTHRMVTVLHALVLLTMNHSQQLSRLMEVKCDLKSSFEWQSLMKYHLITDTQTESTTQEGHHDLCYVEILGTQLPYGYEYLGPEHWILVNTPSTDRAILGILLALTSYRCGFVSGPCMSGKRKTVVQLGRALGRQVISLQCCVNTSPSIVQQMLFGALQTGAWLVLDCVDLMTQGVLSQLGQHLSDIHQSLSFLQRNTQQKGFETHTKPSSSFSYPNGDGTVSPRDSHGNIRKECKMSNELECQMSFSGKNIFAKLSYGCVIISSRGYTTEVPENLRVATRPISLAHPDYRIITEVMLVSLGFSDAVSISRRLISLFSLAKDSLCLPDSVSGEQTSWMVLLRNVIAASGTHLRSNSRLDVHMEKVLREEPDAPRLPLDGILKPPETVGGDKGPQSTHYKRANQSAALMQAVLEEQAVVNSVLSVLLSAIFEQKKASQFRTIFEEIFPMARSHPILQQYIEEEGEQNLLKSAVTEELQQIGFHADTRVLRNALTLYQAMKLSRAVLLVGPAGSGKTTCYRALAGALRRLAARAEKAEFDEDLTSEGDGTETDYQSSTSNWSSVDTVVLFPNALSHEELFGGCYEQQGSWWDGAFTKVLRDSERHDFSATATSKKKKKGGQTRKGKWLVMDGEPLGQPGWLDPFSTLCNPEDPFLCLSSGEKVRPSHKELKLLAEVTDLGDAAPSAVTRCNLVYLSGKDLWKAVWKVEMDALYREHSLDQGTLKMWNRLAEDLFSSTLTFIRHKALTPVMQGEGDGSSKFSKGITYGLQEVNSFIRILHALLEQFGKGRGLKATPRTTDKREINPVGAHPTCTDALIPSTQQEIQARNLFLVAYIWGFGGHLHPRHWPQFDLLAREALFESRYRVEVPSEGTVFEHFFNLSEGMIGDTSNPINCSRSKSPQMAYTTVPQDRPHIRLPASPRLRSTDLRNVLESMGCQKTRLGTMGTMLKQPGLLLFVDDLHEAPCDAFGKTSMALETLRQCISRGGVLTSDGYHFKLFSSGAISYLGTCRTSGVGNQSDCNQISSRLSRHFSILVLPSLSVDVLFSIHSPRLQNWLKEFPCMPRYTDMARCIITATLDLYYAVCEEFQPNVHRPHFLFSMHDLQKVFQGICLWAPRNYNRQPLQKKVSLRVVHSSSALPSFAPATLGPAANMLNIARLWMHECLRTFGDRLCSEDEGQALVSLMAKVSERHYSSRMRVKPQTARAEDTPGAASTRPSTYTPPPTPTDYQKSSHQRPSTPKQPAKSPLPMKAETITEQEEQAEFSDRVSSSDSSSWGSSEDDLFGEIYPKKQENVKKKHVKKPLKEDMSFFQLTQLTSSSHQALNPSPPKGPKPVNQSDWKRSHKLCEQTPQTEPSPARSLVPLQLLQDMETAIQHVVFSVELLEPLPSMSQQHNFKRNSAYLERDLGLLVQQLAFTVKSKEEEEEEEFDDNYSSTSCYTVHRQRVCQLVHVLRALLIPGGHGALFGAVRGTGRKTTVRLAAYLTGYQLMEVHPGNESQLREMLREAGGQAGVHGGNVVILVHEETSQAARDELLVVMADGTFPGLYSDEELKNLVLRINAVVKNSRNRLRDDQALEKYFRQTQRNVHVFLLLPFSPDTSEMHPENASVTLAVAHMTKALSLCCCVEVYQPWSTQVSTILARVKDMTDTAEQHSQEVVRLKRKIAETQQRVTDTERTLCEQARQHCLLEENRLSHLEEQTHQAQQQAEHAFKETALDALQSLSTSGLVEVRRYRFPPDGVIIVMDAICLLFNRPRNWESSKQLLGQSNFFQELEFFDCSMLSDDLFRQLGQIVQQRAFLPESVRGVSRACESLCRWVRAVYQYACVQRHMAPQEARKKQLEVRMAESRARLRVARLQEEEAREQLEDMERQQQFLRMDLEELTAQLRKAETLEREAAAAVQQVQCHITDWTAAAKETEMNNQTISGDALLLAATITYLGPFVPDVRMVLLGKWRELCLSGHININPEDPRTSLLPNSASVAPGPPGAPLHVPIPMGAELQMALARAVGVDQRLVLGVPPRLLPGDDTTAQREGEYELVVSADDPDLLDKVRQGAEKGLRVLVTHVERAVPSPEFLEVLVRPAGSRSPGLRRPVQTAHPEFCLFLSTPLPVRLILNEIHPSILSEVRVIDLSLSSTEVQELMLTELVQSECLELWVQQCLVNTDKKALQDKLCQEEDPEFLPRVSACQTACQKLQAEIMELSMELERHKPLLADFHRVAGLATALYQALQEVARLSPFYLFPLRNFLFAVRGTLVLKGRPDVTFSGEVVTAAVMAEITHRMVSHLLAQYRPCLFQSHATLLRLLVSVALFLHNEGCSEVERLAFLRGLGEMDLPVDASTPASPPPSTSPSQHHVLLGWMPPHTHTEVLRLQNIPAFKGLLSSLATSPSQWQEYLRFPSSTVVGPVPCHSHSHLSMLQRALLWKTMLPHSLAAVAEDLAACHLGQPVQSAVTGAPHTGSPEALSRFLNKHDGPVIVTLPGPSRDGWASIQPLHWLKQVKVISFGAKCQKEAILSALKIAVHDGHWLVFNNCHLLEQWDEEVMCQLNQLISCAAKGHQTDVETEGLIPVGLCAGSRVHSRFRLWFITRGYTPLSIPASMRVCALRLVCDSPWDVKEELCSSLRQVVSVTLSAPSSGVTACTMEPMLRAAILHSVLLQRQAYKYLGQGNIYHWTQEDLLALVDAQVRIAKVCGDPTGALEYIADLADLEAVESVSRACLRAAPPLWGSGPHTLSDIIHIPGRFDLSGLLQSLEQRVQALANTSDPLVLGFSAGLAGELVKVHSRTLNTLLQDSQKPFGRVRSTNELTHPALLPDFNQARDRLLALKESLGRMDDIRVVSVGAPSLGPLRNFLQAEWDGLVDVVSSLHSELNQPMRNSKPTVSSLLNVSSLFRLERRAELLKAYLCDEATSGPSNAYRLSAFSNARGFLGALIREAAHAKQRDISNVSLHFQVLSAATSPASLPLSGVYLCGLELRGALWDTRLGALQDTLSPQPCILPLLWVRARVRNTDTVRAPDSPPCNTSSLPLYHCPLYLDGEHGDRRYWELAENNIIARVPLVAKLDPVLCTLRRVRL
ncbi:unnamed protein product, partial [Coregonus sp. 'balchen']